MVLWAPFEDYYNHNSWTTSFYTLLDITHDVIFLKFDYVKWIPCDMRGH